MKTKTHPVFILVLLLLLISWNSPDQNRLTEKHNGYIFSFTAADKNNIKEYKKFIDRGISAVKAFFHSSFKKEFTVFVYPNRKSLDSAWQKDWQMPAFKSQCWMVASGVATRLDMIAPKIWDKESCEHVYAETNHTQQLITHELVHVFHGQLNSSPDFNNVEGIDWFVEGLATFASGQLDSTRIAEVKKAIWKNKIPTKLDDFWTGNIKYGLAGSVVKFIDHKYGRTKLKELLPYTKKSQLLAALKTTEPDLLKEWQNFIEHL